jgi:ribosomal protein L21E
MNQFNPKKEILVNIQKVRIKEDFSVHPHLPHRKYQNCTGEIVGKRGDFFEVLVKFRRVNKTLFLPWSKLSFCK